LNYVDNHTAKEDTYTMPRSRMDELFEIAEENDGLFMAKEARERGITGSVLSRLAQRGRLERAGRGVYRIPHYRPDRMAQYREAILLLRSSRGPEQVALSHETALAIYGISDANPSRIHVTAPNRARLRRQRPKWIVIHRGELKDTDINRHEGLPVTSIEKTLSDVLDETGRLGLVRQALRDARKEGYVNADEAARLRRKVDRYAGHLSKATEESSIP
jgi:predicted transcriptional regulator of viral defense system